MISSRIVIGITVAYLAILFIIAYLVERKFMKGKNLSNNALVYTLALAIYCTAWTFYGNVGLAVTSSYLFLGVYLGPTLVFIFGWVILKKLVRIKNLYNITSIADFISVRYGKSSIVAALASAIAIIGIVPYLSLQLKAVFTSYEFITTGNGISAGGGKEVELIVIAAIILFTIIFGLRRLDQTERHPGMVMVVAIQSIVKLGAFLAVGIFVTYFLYGGFGDISKRIAENSALAYAQKGNSPSFSLFMAYIVLSMGAILFLPRQFHMAIVENVEEKHIRTAIWLLPLYLIVITIFVIPVAMAGILQGYDTKMADYFMLLLPLKHGNFWLSLLVFIGGASAAFSMIMVSAVTLTTMAADYLVLPFFEIIKIGSVFRRHILILRWMLVSSIILIAYLFEIKIGSSYVLVKMGMISFAAVLQFAPAVIGALFWEKGNKAGAIMGMGSGFILWAYTSLIPAFIRSGWINDALLRKGPWGLSFLRPENLLNITNLDPLALTVLFSMIFNIGFYILGSIIFEQSEKENKLAVAFFDTDKEYDLFSEHFSKQEALIDLSDKSKIVNSIFGHYLNSNDAQITAKQCMNKAGLDKKNKITLSELIALSDIIEKTLASYIGAPAASEALTKKSLFTHEETESLSGYYLKMATELKLTPKELSEKINYHEEKAAFLKKQGEELEEMVKRRTKELEEKNRELEKFQNMTVGRELKMVELKERMKELEKTRVSS
jgi:Na+/proline symporter